MEQISSTKMPISPSKWCNLASKTQFLAKNLQFYTKNVNFHRKFRKVWCNDAIIDFPCQHALRLLAEVFVQFLSEITEFSLKLKQFPPNFRIFQVLEATVVSAGAGLRNEKGELVALTVKPGDRVLLPEYGGTKVQNATNFERKYGLIGEFLM